MHKLIVCCGVYCFGPVRKKPFPGAFQTMSYLPKNVTSDDVFESLLILSLFEKYGILHVNNCV